MKPIITIQKTLRSLAKNGSTGFSKAATPVRQVTVVALPILRNV
jgi:hypothetical protein